jgi:DNA-binding transcriptional ArsR family regulator
MIKTASRPKRPLRTKRTSPFIDRVEVCVPPCVDVSAVRRARSRMQSPGAVSLLAETFSVLGDPTRLRIAYALSQHELCVCDIASVLEMSQSVVSHSLRALRQMRLVRSRKDGRIVYYTLDDDHIASLLRDGFKHVMETL